VTAAVTVLMPVFNGEAFVRQSIESILRQTWTDFELVIVDDGSTDATPRILASFRDPRTRVITSPRREGIACALNRGLASASAPLVARQDADDVSHPARLEKQLAFLEANRSIVVLGTQIRVIDERGRVSHPPGWRRPLTHAGIRFVSMFDNPFIHGSVVFRREVVGPYDATLESAEDFDLWSRVAAHHPVANLPEALVDHRVHSESMAAAFGDAHAALVRVIIERNVRDVLGVANVTDFESLWRHYPERKSADVRRAAAVKFGDIALSLATCHRTAALNAFGHAVRCDSRTASAFLSRFVPLLLFGESARGMKRWLTTASRASRRSR
jgi:glycosyltransferase involved in cell wall biosynthesis